MDFYTIGYGHTPIVDLVYADITRWGEFKQRLEGIDVIADIRHEGHGSIGGETFDQGVPIQYRLNDIDVEYEPFPRLGMIEGQSLVQYKEHFDTLIMGETTRDRIIQLYGSLPEDIFPEYYEYLKLRNLIDKTPNVALMGTTRDVRRCHRRVLANQVAKDLNVTVTHL